ncbi:hypothetical protein LJ753_16625 [Arthrobacter sp. zg-Y20]|uniref:hypothetical protein n=1 Tax=unclassified Arthrobacter TaxID=235627 RepID=UPI001D147AD1|nr:MULTISPECIES: hypothetical protein [unclassified Arthrobacter]MCC3277490.1 hypothetical protein [Arthrobacter sp. zg-Y20]MDK1317651.1 hypothetical protein [Arthrobacter sp. zg.Y20]WIB07089.1 hypothetical protein QNO06_04995 [Arthrobacter sp. zg-Y20]
MSKHAHFALWSDRTQQAPKHSAGWSTSRHLQDVDYIVLPHTPGKHTKPFGKHHPAQPITKAPTANVTPLKKRRTQAPTGCRICDDLDIAA